MSAFLTYLTTAALLVLVLRRTAAVARGLSIPPVLSSAVVAVALIYLSCLIPGALGLLYTPLTQLLFAALSVTVLILSRRLGGNHGIEGPAVLDQRPPPTVPDWLLAGAGLLLTLPLLSYLRWGVIGWFRDANTPLTWDTVSYHLPGFIEFWQNHSLWSLDGPYQSYSFAFELIGNFFSQPFFAPWGLIVAHLFAIGLLILSIAIAAEQLCRLLPGDTAARSLPPILATLGIWTFIHSDSIGDVGKNDIFTTACLTAALCFLFALAASNDQRAAHDSSLVVLIALALGLALAAKPSALAFVPFFALATPAALFLRRHEAGDVRRRALIAAGIVLSVSALLGGFWLIRNLLAYGRLSPLAGAWNLSLIANLENPALFEVKRGSVLFALGVAAVLPGLALLFLSRNRRREALPLAFLLAFHLVACAAFAMTPHAIFHHSLDSSVWKLRLGMPLFVSAGMIYSLSIQYLGNRLSSLAPRHKAVLTSATVLALLALLPMHRQRIRILGLPGYEVIKGLPQTEVYRWVQAQDVPRRIYSAGLRPYGLYGRTWGNRLFYDLHSVTLSPLEAGQARIAAIVDSFKPDLIIISVDPHSYTGPAEKPEIVEWMKQQTRLFDEAYRDDAVSAFEVRPQAADQLRSLIPAGYVLKMGG